MPTKEEIWNKKVAGWRLSMTNKGYKNAMEAMDEYAEQCVKENAGALCNLIVEECNIPELSGTLPTVGELREIIRLHAKQESIGFFIWYGMKTVTLIKSVIASRGSDIEAELNNQLQKHEGKTIDQLYFLYQQGKTKQP